MKTLTLGVLLLLTCRWAAAQTYPFARLTGSPKMDTHGWLLTGDARPGDTGGDDDNLDNEMVLCNPTPGNRGACFFKQPVNIAQCQKWTAEFEYRIFDGTGADGIAFCFLNNPPDAFTVGGNIGIPARPQGLMVIIDTYLNCTHLASERVPKLLIRYADGNTTYGGNTENLLECPAAPQPTSTKLDFLRQPVYNRMKVTYDQGRIEVFVNDVFVLRGNYPINFPGYFGFTASTGGSNDRHSIRDFTLYTFKPIVSPPDAGRDRTVCSGDEVELGVPPLPGDPYSYNWYPAGGLSNPKASNPKVRLFNDSTDPVTYTYFVTKDSAANENLCAFSDEVQITVLGKIAQAGPDLSVCSGDNTFINALDRDGYRYAWSPATGLSDPAVARPFVRLENTTAAPVTYQYVLTVTPLAAPGCSVYDTLRVTVAPSGAAPPRAVALCSGDTVRLGALPVPGFNYTWSPATGLDNRAAADPALTLTNPTASPQVFQYVRNSRNLSATCQWWDTVTVTVSPRPVIAGPRSVCPNVTGVVYRIAGPQAGETYQWTVQGGTIRSGAGTSRITVDWGPTRADASVAVVAGNAPDCQSRLPVSINPVLKPETPAGPDTLCTNASRRIGYETAFTTGSVYTWGVSGNGTIAAGQGTHAVTVDWQGTGTGALWVSERSVTQTDVCEGVSDTLRVWLQPAPGPQDVFIHSVSTQPEQEKNILLRLRVNPGVDVGSALTVSRRTLLPEAGNWEAVRSVTPRDSLFTDPDLATGEQVYEYRLSGADNCNQPFVTVPHHSILLAGGGDEELQSVQLEWNAYAGWPGGVKRYEIWRKLDDETAFSPYGQSGPGELRWSAANAREGFRHCYRIRAQEEGGRNGFSWSNETCVAFEHPLFIPNVITPNGDGYNDAWTIRNLELYRQHELIVVNRYGKTVLKTNAYRQDWRAEGLAAGLYYYALTTAQNAQTLRGWVQVMR